MNQQQESYLVSTAVIDWDAPAIRAQAQALQAHTDVVGTAKSCFHFVRDQIKHSRDYQRNPVTWRASDVLRYGTGYCYAKSHLLAALLRANGIAAGFCYQRLSVNDTGPPYSLHGFCAVWLPEYGWYRVDPRGNKPGVEAIFAPPVEHLAFGLQSSEEVEFENVLADPLPLALEALQHSLDWKDALVRLPDVLPEEFPSLGLVVRRRGGSV